MNFSVRSQVISFLCLVSSVLEASYQCGIRQHGFLPLVYHGWQVEKGFWPWHTAVFHKQEGVGFQYGCGGTLVNERYVITAAHCAVKRQARTPLPAILYEIELHFGQHNLSMVNDDVVIRDVDKVYVHPDYSTNINDIAVLVMRLLVEYTEYVIPICLDQRVDRDLRDLEGQRGWVTGWGTTENGTISEVLRTLSLPVVNYVECLKDDRILFGHTLDETVFCAGIRNGTSPGPGDSGGGLYLSDGDRWVLRGIVSFGKLNRQMGVNPYKYTVFVNVQRYLTWIKEVFAENEPRLDSRQMRISEIECERFQTLVKKRRNGDCLNNRYPHDVMVIRPDGELLGNGVLVDEQNVITSCSCIRSINQEEVYTEDSFPTQYQPAKVKIITYADLTIAEMFCHPKFVEGKVQYDLAVLKLNVPVMLDSTLIPACLANKWTENLYDILLQTSFNFGDVSSLIESDENQIIPSEKCSSLIVSRMLNRSSNIGELCVVNTDELRKNSYNTVVSTGDALQSSNRRSCMSTMVGVKSSSVEVFPSKNFTRVEIYARISHHLDWIEQSIWQDQPEVDLLNEEFRCGFRYGFVNMWPWTAAISRKNFTSGSFEFTCSATIIGEKHILTTAQCVVNNATGRPFAEDTFEVRAGHDSLGEHTIRVQIRYVSEVHVHPEYSVHDVAMLVTSWPFRITLFVKPICVVSDENSNFWNLEEKRASIVGWTTIESGNPRDNRQSVDVRILGNRQCSEASLELFGNYFAPNMGCSVDDEGILSVADRGSGVYHETDGADWTLVGMVSTQMKGNGSEKYTIFVSVQPYFPWIDNLVRKSRPGAENRPKRVSETECERFRSLSRKDNGVCENGGKIDHKTYPHIVTLLGEAQKPVCSGVLVKENRVLTACQCIRGIHRPTKIKIKINWAAKVVNITEMICHPEYNSTNSDHDVAIVKLSSPVELSSVLIPACLANIWTENLNDTILQTTFVRNPKENTASIISRYDSVATEEDCNRVMPPNYRKKQPLKPSQFCVIASGTPSYTLNGGTVQSVDSRSCRFTVLGIESTRRYNRDLSGVTIVHRVAHYLDWIEQVVWDEEVVISTNVKQDEYPKCNQCDRE